MEGVRLRRVWMSEEYREKRFWQWLNQWTTPEGEVKGYGCYVTKVDPFAFEAMYAGIPRGVRPQQGIRPRIGDVRDYPELSRPFHVRDTDDR